MLYFNLDCTIKKPAWRQAECHSKLEVDSEPVCTWLLSFFSSRYSVEPHP